MSHNAFRVDTSVKSFNRAIHTPPTIHHSHSNGNSGNLGRMLIGRTHCFIRKASRLPYERYGEQRTTARSIFR